MADTTLRQAFSNIANAIRAKGVTGTMTPLQMPTKVASISSSKYGVSGDSVLGNVNGQGELQQPTQQFQFTSSDIVVVPANMLRNKFYNNTGLVEVNLPNLTSVESYGMSQAFYQCSSLTSVDLPNLTSIGNYGMQYAFYGCTSLTSVDLSSLTSVGQYGFSNAFYGCTSLTTVLVKKLYSVNSSSGFNNAFTGCTALELVDFSEATAVPALSNVNAFSNTNNTYSIVVPDSLYSSWIASSNWSDSTIVGHIVKASEYTPAS